MVSLEEDSEKDMIHYYLKRMMTMSWEPYSPTHFVTAADERNNFDNSSFHN